MPITGNLTIYQGANFSGRFVAKDDYGNILNLSGYSAKGHARVKYSNTGVMLNLSPVVVSAVSGLVDVIISGGLITGLPITRAPYDIQVYSGNSIYRIQQGYLEINPEVTY